MLLSFDLVHKANKQPSRALLVLILPHTEEHTVYLNTRASDSPGLLEPFLAVVSGINSTCWLIAEDP